MGIIGRRQPSTESRFWAKVQKRGPDECWPWAAGRFARGYGAFAYGKKRPGMAHRYSYELHNGPLDDGDIIMHTCDNPICVNPAHLRRGSQQDNIQDAVKKDRWMTHKRRQHLKRIQAAYRRVCQERRPKPALPPADRVKPEDRVYVPEPGDGYPLHKFIIGEGWRHD